MEEVLKSHPYVNISLSLILHAQAKLVTLEKRLKIAMHCPFNRCIKCRGR